MKRKLNYFIFALLFVGVLTVKCDVVEAATVVAEDTLPETVTRGEIQYSFISGMNYQAGITSYPFYNESSDGKYQLYCSDRNNGVYQAGDVLTKGDKLDYGLASMLFNKSAPFEYAYARLFSNNSYTPVSESDTTPTRMLDTWIMQAVIWGYQGTLSSNNISSDLLQYRSKDDATSAYELYLDTAFSNGVFGTAIWNQYVSKEVEAAKAANAKNPENSQLSIKVDGNWTKVNGTNNVKSGLINVSRSINACFGHTCGPVVYSITLDNAPSGTRIYTEDGKDVTSSISNLSNDKKIYLVVNKDNVKNDVKFTIKAASTIEYPVAYQYIDKTTGHQPSILVGKESKDLSAALEMTLSPDTALSVSNSIYFLGFMILISGVFIIYANVKTKKQNAE